RHDPQPEASWAQRVLDRVGHAVEPVYGFGSLLAFKAKFQPVYRPLMLAYPESAALPGIAVAIVRAYLPALTVRQAVRLVRLTLRHPGRRAAGPPGPAAPAPCGAPVDAPPVDAPPVDVLPVPVAPQRAGPVFERAVPL